MFMSMNAQKPYTDFSLFRQEIRTYQKEAMLPLMAALVGGIVLSFVLSFLVSAAGGESGSMPSLLLQLITSFVAVLINNLIYLMFLKKVRKEKYTSKDFVYMMGMFAIQIVCAVLLSILQSVILTFALVATSVIPYLNYVLSAFFTVVFTFISALIVFRIYDRKTKLRDMFSGACNLIGRNFKLLLMTALLYIVWMVVSNIAFAMMVYEAISEVNTTSNILMALLSVGNMQLLVGAAIFYVVNFVVSAALQVPMLLGVALLYEKDRENCYIE